MFLAVAGLAAQAYALAPSEQIVRRGSASSSASLLPWPMSSASGAAPLAADVRRQLQQAGQNMASAPPTVTISGFMCHPSAAAAMALDPAPIRSRPHYVSSDGAQHLVKTNADIPPCPAALGPSATAV